MYATTVPGEPFRLRFPPAPFDLRSPHKAFTRFKIATLSYSIYQSIGNLPYRRSASREIAGGRRLGTLPFGRANAARAISRIEWMRML